MTTPKLVALRTILAKLYPEEKDIRLVLHDASIDPTLIDLDRKSIIAWQAILEDAQKTNQPCVSIISETISSRKIVSKTGQRSKGNVSNESHQPESNGAG